MLCCYRDALPLLWQSNVLLCYGYAAVLPYLCSTHSRCSSYGCVDAIAPTCSRWRTERNYRPRRVYGACFFIALYDHQNRPRKKVQQKTRSLRVSVLSSRPMQPFDRWYFISRCLLPGNARWCCCLSIATTCRRWLIKKRKRLHRVSLCVFCL